MKRINKLLSTASDFALLLVFSILAGCLVSGCASIGAAPAQSVSEQVDYGRALAASVATTCNQQLSAGVLSLDGAQKCLATIDTANAALDAAKLASAAGSEQTALTNLAAASAVLTQLQTTLNSKGK